MNKNLMDLVAFSQVVCGDALLIDGRLRFVATVDHAEWSIDSEMGVVYLEFEDRLGSFYRYNAHALVAVLHIGAA